MAANKAATRMTKSAPKSGKKPASAAVSRKPTGNSRKAGVRPTYDEIAARAFAVWEARGKPMGRDMENWREAEAQLKLERGIA
jgi:Protein of unknown function (DUF2934)